ncbi:hypothetical protein M8J77_024553 [Diaphorina citri]|nr:hypothetical protein M8J77_024553 [Diaphorina citri]
MLRPATHYQVDLTTGTPDQGYLTPDEHTHYQVDLTGAAEMVRLSGLPDEYTHYQVDLIRCTCRHVYLIDEVPKLGGAYNLRQCRGLRGGAQDEVLPVVVNIKAPG